MALRVGFRFPDFLVHVRGVDKVAITQLIEYQDTNTTGNWDGYQTAKQTAKADADDN
jgi:hypothetical protein